MLIKANKDKSVLRSFYLKSFVLFKYSDYCSVKPGCVLMCFMACFLFCILFTLPFPLVVFTDNDE